jgi:alcohol dehydrogenase
MKAVQLPTYGDSSVLQIVDVADPVLKPGQILVKNHASSVNPFDIKIASGIYKDAMPLTLPAIPGGDYAGVVTQVSEGVTDFAIGDEVFGSANLLSGGSGAFAETVAANAKNSAKKPKQASFEEAAALVLTGVSAIQALEEHMKLQGGQKILIHGGAGGIGTAAIQIAKAIGAHVATTVSTDDIDFVKQLGADEVIDYKSEKFEEKLSDFDAVYVTVPGDTADRSFQVLKPNGVMVSMVGKPNEELAKQKNITAVGQSTHVTTEILNRLAELVDSGKIKAQIDKSFTPDQIKEAYDIVENVHPRGKVVLKSW